MFADKVGARVDAQSGGQSGAQRGGRRCSIATRGMCLDRGLRFLAATGMTVMLGAAAVLAPPGAAYATQIPLEAVSIAAPRPLRLAEGEEVTLRGSLRTSHDGAEFDASAGYTEAGVRRGPGLFDLEGGGLVMVGHREAQREVRVVASAGPGAGCVAAGLTSPCLLPRLGVLAHARLLTTAAFAGTLAGQVALVRSPPMAAFAAHERLSVPVGIGLLSLALVATWLIAVARRRRRFAATPWGEVEVAARQVGALLGEDPGLGEVRRQVRDLVERGQAIERARIAASQLLERAGLRRDGALADASPEVAIARARETAARARIAAEVAAHETSLRKIGASLRTACFLARSTPAALVELQPGGLLVGLDEALSRRDDANLELALLAPHGIFSDR